MKKEIIISTLFIIAAFCYGLLHISPILSVKNHERHVDTVYITHDYSPKVIPASIYKNIQPNTIKINTRINDSTLPLQQNDRYLWYLDAAVLFKERIIDSGLTLLTGKGKFRALEAAAATGDIELLEMLIPIIDDIDTPLYPKHSNAIMTAAVNKQIEFISALLDYNADINSATSYGYSPLKAAIKSKDLSTVTFLLENGARFGSNNGISEIAYAIGTSNDDIIDILLDYGASFSTPSAVSPLYIAVHLNDIKLVKQILKENVDINHHENLTGFTPLIAAIRVEATEIVHLLLEQHIDVNAHDNYGNTAIHTATINANEHIIHKLLMNGSNIDEPHTNTGETPIMIAAKNNNDKLYQFFLNAGADEHIRDYSGNSAKDYRKDQKIKHLKL